MIDADEDYIGSTSITRRFVDEAMASCEKREERCMFKGSVTISDRTEVDVIVRYEADLRHFPATHETPEEPATIESMRAFVELLGRKIEITQQLTTHDDGTPNREIVAYLEKKIWQDVEDQTQGI